MQPGHARARPAADDRHVRPDKVDAYLWINRPGFAQSCQGRPIAWFVPRALSYARFATDWERPPPGTRFGFRERFPFKTFMP